MNTMKKTGFAAVCSMVMAVMFARLQVYADLAPLPPQEPQPMRIWPALVIAAVVIIALVLYLRYKK